MRVVILNCGSPSIKGAVIDCATEEHLCAVRAVVAELRTCVDRVGPIGAFAHRAVHGGARFVEPALIDDASLHSIDELSPLAPAPAEAKQVVRSERPHRRKTGVDLQAHHNGETP